MSCRVWLGDRDDPSRVTIADYSLFDYPSMEALCADCAFLADWVFSPTKELMDQFLKIVYCERDRDIDNFVPQIRAGEGWIEYAPEWAGRHV
jgi:hypothetical protein